ncbi:MAG: NADH-quinone oxidoreductase subunit C [Spirochaetales bacterium]|nr:NADH-quinone oxidoreductase subunit C [Spirochaetales bacterium]
MSGTYTVPTGRPEAARGEKRSASAIVAAIAELGGESGFAVKAPRRVEGRVEAAALHGFAAALRMRVGFEHLSAISCVDWLADGEFELVYHFWSYRDNCLVSAHVRIPRDTATMATLTDLWQPASFFERDIHEMFGVEFLGNEDLEKYILTDWKGPPPMRKDFVSRDFAHDHFTYKNYEPSWDEMIDGGYYSGGQNGGQA